MASDRPAFNTQTEQIAHAICDRYNLPPCADLCEVLRGIALHPEQAQRILDASDRVRIRVGYGLDFTVSAKLHSDVQRSADRTGLTHFIGVLPDGVELSGCDRDELRKLGCRSIAWIIPWASDGHPSAADLDAVMEEQRIAEATAPAMRQEAKP